MFPHRDHTIYQADWLDGKALCALVDSYSKAIPSWNDDSLSADDKNTQALVLAQEKLDIPPLIGPSDVGQDELCLVCYLSYLFNMSTKKKLVPRPLDFVAPKPPVHTTSPPFPSNPN